MGDNTKLRLFFYIREGEQMNWRVFDYIIRKYRNGKITREAFIPEWRIAQKEQRLCKK